jgi:hypothetical protein
VPEDRLAEHRIDPVPRVHDEILAQPCHDRAKEHEHPQRHATAQSVLCV